MNLKYFFSFVVTVSSILSICSAQDEVDNGYIFTSPRTLNKGQNNQLQLLRFGCLEESILQVQVYYSDYYSSNSKETLAKEQIFQLQQGQKDSLFQLYLTPPDSGNNAYSGRIKINGTMCGKTISGSDNVYFADPSSYIYIIQTDKHLYKPGQKVRFRVLKLDKNLKPTNSPYDLGDIFVEDPQGTRLFQYKRVQLGHGIVQKEFPLADEPVHGTWRITVKSDQDTESTTFDVKEYKLPKFSVSIKFPSFVLENAESIPISVCAEYTYGEPVKGILNVNTSLEMYSYESSYSRTPILQDSVQLDGCYNYTVQVSSIDPDGNHRYKRVMVKANVVEQGTGTQINDTQYLSRSYSPLKLDFNTGENQGEFYKPGLPYNGKLKVTNPDDTPAPGEPIEICATVTRKRVIDNWLSTRKTKYCSNYTSDANGIIKFTIIPQNVDSVSIDLDATSLKYTRDNTDLSQPTDFASLSPFFSPSGSFLQLETISEPLPCGSQKNVRVLFTSKENSEFKLHYQILKQGKVVSNGVKDVTFNIQNDVSSKYEKENEIIDGSETQLVPVPEPSSSADSSSNEEYCPSARESRYIPPIGEAYIPINIDADLSPSFTLLVFYIREDRETVADSQKIQVEKCFKNKVTFMFANMEGQPGTPTAYQITSSPNSLCGVKVVDKSVNLLDSNDQLTKDKVFQLLEDLNTNDYYTSYDLCDSMKSQPGLSSEVTQISSSPDSYHASSYEDSYAAFQEAGFLVISNLILFSRPCIGNGGGSYYDDEYVTGEYLTAEYESAEYFSDEAAGGPAGAAAPAFQPVAHAKRVAVTNSAVSVRDYFPETWLFQLQMTGPDGMFQKKVTLPHTITEWIGNAACVSAQDGLGISDMTSIYGFQAFFISYTLPVTVTRGEVFTVVVSLFSYVDAALPIAISVDPSDGFTVVSDLSDTEVCIQPRTSNSQQIKLQGMKLGAQNITVRAQTASSSQVCGGSPVYSSYARDAITQSVEIEAEGFPAEEVTSVLFCPQDEENQEFSQSFPLSTPGYAVPDSARAIVDITGNVMGPAMQNLNNLVALPTGCGEQNMVKFTPNYLVLNYLTDIGELTDSIKSTAIKNLNTGYQRELTYRHYDGSFSAFGNNDKEGSMFLTAFVLRSFYQAKKYIFIDDSVITDAQNWITSRQQEDGCFPDVGQIIDSGIQGGLQDDKNEGTITAYVLASLFLSKYNNLTVIGNGLGCMNKHPATNPYETFLYAYVGALSGNKGPTQMIIDNIKPQANITDGMEYYQNPGGSKSLDIETTAYAVLTNLKIGNSKSEVLPLVRYLTSNLNPSGGFQSTQDTCVGLNALSKFAKFVYNDPVEISVTLTGGLQENLEISEYNQLVVQRNEVTQIPNVLNIDAIGTGCGLLQTSLRYNTLTPPEQNQFSIQVTGQNVCMSPECKGRKITTVVRYLPDGRKSGMSVVQIKMVTGTVPDKDSLDQLVSDKNNNILRADVENNKVNIYLSEISNNPQVFSFDAEAVVEVENPQPGMAKVFDYYAPEYSASTTYAFP
ncbi:Murinoglobulin-1 like protein [Argiope bruennichi]|uniref:TEP1-F n=1 Tax=Argiope bruennichi TaxID=94029 RepID=A0A8T0G160_ARGBR|nr:Murinoglobulin-1 like protein [Argiope bruennichi]